jgi:hypothetical protein
MCAQKVHESLFDGTAEIYCRRGCWVPGQGSSAVPSGDR